jgi:hypothetical protein
VRGEISGKSLSKLVPILRRVLYERFVRQRPAGVALHKRDPGARKVDVLLKNHSEEQETSTTELQLITGQLFKSNLTFCVFLIILCSLKNLCIYSFLRRVIDQLI